MAAGDYHLLELSIARDAGNPAALNPRIEPGERVLDLGCGAGQTLIATLPEGHSPPGLGVDIDHGALKLGCSLTDRVRFVNASASALPFRDGEFDVVIARLSLPYMHINRALCEARRVLRPGGRLWAALHPFQVPWEKVKRANWKGRVYFAYVMINSALFHWVQREISFPGGMRETFQTERGIRRALRTAGFSRVVREVRGGLKFAVTAFVD